MRIEEYLDTVCAQIKWKAAKPVVREELRGHLQEHVDAFQHAGDSLELAEQRAVAQMGDAAKTGIDLNRIHRPRYDWMLIGALAGLMGLGLLQAALAHHQPITLLSATIVGLVPMALFAFINVYRLLRNKWIMLVVCLALFGGLTTLAFTETMYDFRTTYWYNLITDVPVALLMVAFGSWIPRIRTKGSLSLYLGSVLVCTILMFMIPITMLALTFLVCLWAMLWQLDIKHKKLVILLLSVIGLLVVWYMTSGFTCNRASSWIEFVSSGETSAGWQYWQIKYRVAGLQWFGAGIPSLNIYQYGSSLDEYALIGFMWKYGLAAGLSIVAICAVALWRIYRIVLLLQDRTSRAVAIGICTYVTMQVMWNLLMNFGVTPGLLVANLPFFSQVWPQSLILGTMFGILIGLYRRKDNEAPTLSPVSSPHQDSHPHLTA